ncbi:hypothetical protein Tcan_03880 [Toxocara canis]|uniref:Uncharacterized protein n=1 Tax=Toxocara canis TaxID=6265 RepID=A0A0B2URW1_TOXCA|nr:hypothetical protein Tcan_03880 [Toxocara canis]
MNHFQPFYSIYSAEASAFKTDLFMRYHFSTPGCKTISHLVSPEQDEMIMPFYSIYSAEASAFKTDLFMRYHFSTPGCKTISHLVSPEQDEMIMV